MPFPISATIASEASNGSARTHRTAPHRRNAALRSRSDSPYQQRGTLRDNPTQLLIKQAVEHLIRQLEAGKSEALTEYLSAMARFHSYSFGNILAIARQKPDAQRVAGIRTWNELGRFVNKGEKGIQILAPMIGYKRRRNTNEEAEPEQEPKPQSVLIGFRIVTVFERLSRDLRSRFYAVDVVRHTPRALGGGSHMIAQILMSYATIASNGDMLPLVPELVANSPESVC